MLVKDEPKYWTNKQPRPVDPRKPIMERSKSMAADKPVPMADAELTIVQDATPTSTEGVAKRTMERTEPILHTVMEWHDPSRQFVPVESYKTDVVPMKRSKSMAADQPVSKAADTAAADADIIEKMLPVGKTMPKPAAEADAEKDATVFFADDETQQWHDNADKRKIDFEETFLKAARRSQTPSRTVRRKGELDDANKAAADQGSDIFEEY